MKTDVAIVGGGVAGLWVLNRLKSLGYDAHLFEKMALGNGQTIASQGVIHGGKKYALTHTPDALNLMPERWRACFDGSGEINLCRVRVLSESQDIKFSHWYMALAARIGRNGKTRGSKLKEPVINVKTLLESLRFGVRNHIYLGPQPTGNSRALATIYTCGAGNIDFCSLKQTQLRPLNMIMVRGAPRMLYAHYFYERFRPRVTITSHILNGEIIWYIGGGMAEKAVGMNDEQAAAWARHELEAIFPEYNWANKQYACHYVVRGEPASEDGRLPNGPRFISQGNIATAWPTKLALAPLLADNLIEWLKSQGVHPSGRSSMLGYPAPEIAKFPWEVARWIS